MVHERATNAEVRGWHADKTSAESPDWIASASFIADLQFERQAGAIPKPGGQLVIANHASNEYDNSVWGDGLWGYGRWGTSGVSTGYGGVGDQQTIRPGDLIQFWAQFGGPGNVEPELAHRWSGMVRSVYYERVNNVEGYVRINFGGFAQEVLGARRWTGSYEETAISSSTEPSEAILNDLLEDECPELDRSQLPDITQTTSVFGNGKPVIETVAELADLVGATVWTEGEALRFEILEDVDAGTPVIDATDKLASHSLAINDDGLVNVVRVNGGTAESQELSSQETITSYSKVTPTTRELVQLDTSKAAVPRVDLHVENAPADEGDITVRLQRDDAGAPRDVDDSTKDIARSTKDMDEFPYEQNWATWRLPDHNLANPDPWLIVESDGSQGVGVDGTGTLAYRFYYSYPLALQFSDASSQERYRRRETVENRTSLADRQSVRDVAVSEVARNSEPDYELRFEAMADRIHDLRVGDGFTMDRPMDGISGEWVVQSVGDAWEQGNLKTTIRAISKERF